MPWFAVYTAPFKEASVAGLLKKVAAVEEVFVPQMGGAPGDGAMLFTNYVFVRAALEEAEGAVAVQGVRRLVGPDQHRPSPIAEHDLEVLRELCSADRSPMLGPVPSNGRLARITRGAMAGATGIVKHHRGQTVVLAFTLPILAGAYELELPEDSVEVLEERLEEAATHKPRHRSGKRTRRKRG